MERILTSTLLVAALLAAPVAAFAWEGRPAPHVPIPNNAYSRQWNPRFAPGHRPAYRHPHFAGPRFARPPVVVAQPFWIQPTWSWNGWQWVWVPGYWAQ